MSDLLMNGKFNIIIGGQAGSEAKGKLSAYLCEKEDPSLLVMTSSPNAGHTAVLNGEKYVSYHLPIGAVACDARIVLGPASLINPNVLEKEMKALGIRDGRVILDERASVITQRHLSRESVGHLESIGSTLQGIGECRRGKMLRNGRSLLVGEYKEFFRKIGVVVKTNVTGLIHSHLTSNHKVLCEGTQGFDLDLEHGIDPIYCTSKMINPSMMMAEAGVPPSAVGEIWGVIRPYPIRVNNRTGTSGPYAGAKEISWSMVQERSGCPNPLQEITTTTKLPRRVFEFSWSRFRAFIRTCAPTLLCLQFGNYLDWSVYGKKDLGALTPSLSEFIGQLEYESGVPVELLGTGPEQDEMVRLREEVM